MSECKECHKPLRKLEWNKETSMLICDNFRCSLCRIPQGTIINIKEILEITEVNDARNDGRKTKKLRGAKVRVRGRKSKAERRVGGV